MKDYTRQTPSFSLCGLNCGLCPIHHMANGCPGCGGGAGHQSCSIIKCSMQHENIEYCYLCPEYPCDKLNSATDFDSFVPHRNMLADLEKAKNIGVSSYCSQLEEKTAILQMLLAQYNDGRRKSFFCLAVNLLDLADIRCVLDQLSAEAAAMTTLKEKAALAVNLFQAMAKKRDIILKLNKKKKAPKL